MQIGNSLNDYKIRKNLLCSARAYLMNRDNHNSVKIAENNLTRVHARFPWNKDGVTKIGFSSVLYVQNFVHCLYTYEIGCTTKINKVICVILNGTVQHKNNHFYHVN